MDVTRFWQTKAYAIRPYHFGDKSTHDIRVRDVSDRDY